jgi:hypothetical protein
MQRNIFDIRLTQCITSLHLGFSPWPIPHIQSGPIIKSKIDFPVISRGPLILHGEVGESAVDGCKDPHRRRAKEQDDAVHGPHVVAGITVPRRGALHIKAAEHHSRHHNGDHRVGNIIKRIPLQKPSALVVVVGRGWVGGKGVGFGRRVRW